MYLTSENDLKGLGSNAHWWSRLKNPELLWPYLRIAGSLGIPMFVEQKETMCDWCGAIKKEHSAVTFYQPYNARFNVLAARDYIAQHLADRGLSLGPYISDQDLLPDKNVAVNYNHRPHAYTYQNGGYWDRDRDLSPWKSKTVEELRLRAAEALAARSWDARHGESYWYDTTAPAGRATALANYFNERKSSPPPPSKRVQWYDSHGERCDDRNSVVGERGTDDDSSRDMSENDVWISSEEEDAYVHHRQKRYLDWSAEVDNALNPD